MSVEQNAASRRRNRTKMHLQDAFIELIKEKGYHHVSVKDIVNRAAYNRSTFYIHYQDKIQLAEELLQQMFEGLEEAVGAEFETGKRTLTSKLSKPSFNIVVYIYQQRNFFELLKYDDTLPGMHTRFPNTMMKIYQEQFKFETINNMPVNMDYFKRYTAYGFYGLLLNWITNDFDVPQEEFIAEVIELTRTHIHSFEYMKRK